MSLEIGIVGLPNVGKSTLFQIITKKQVEAENYPFCTIDPNIGMVLVPDERVDKLTELTNSAKQVYTTIKFVDIAGLVKGASKGEGLGNKFLANIREVDSVVYVLRCFKNEKIVNTTQKIDPVAEKETLDTEMMLKDLETVAKRIQGLEREVKSGDKKAKEELEVLKKAEEFLKEGKLLTELKIDVEREKKILDGYQLLTTKKRLYLLNGEKNDITKEVLDTFEKNKWPYLIMDIEEEAIKEMGDEILEESKINELIKESYKLLNLITFLTTGSDETRAWTLEKGSIAPQAGGAIHTDFEKSFIKAEVINWLDLIKAGGLVKARETGLIRTEGKEYIIKDGDVIEIKAGL